MVFYLVARLCSIVYVFLYPAYGVYKALQRRPPGLEQQQAQEAERTRWLEYWAVMAFILSAEYAVEWLVSWFPGYWLFKSIFLLWLVAPQTQGATFIFHTFLAPFLSQHEGEIDSYLLRLNSSILALVQAKLGQVLAIVLPSVQQQPQQPEPQAAQTPATYAAGAMLGLFQQYGPSFMSAGANLFQPAGGARSHPPTPGATASGYALRPEMAHQVSQASFNSRSSAGAPSFPVPEVPR